MEFMSGVLVEPVNWSHVSVCTLLGLVLFFKRNAKGHPGEAERRSVESQRALPSGTFPIIVRVVKQCKVVVKAVKGVSKLLFPASIPTSPSSTGQWDGSGGEFECR